jgi:hypothetical protein
VFPIVVHTQDDPSPETQDDPSPETQDKPSPDTQDDPSPDTGTATSESVFRNEPRIVGGSEATTGQFPYQVLLLLSHQNYR